VTAPWGLPLVVALVFWILLLAVCLYTVQVAMQMALKIWPLTEPLRSIFEVSVTLIVILVLVYIVAPRIGLLSVP
jgi:hypothetical protein